ncbi:hydrolase [Sphingobium sp. CCH11-B1]|jgi:glutamate carboxypeptidase|uniref:hydrolase n=1 Tax=Sphingobium sp. CCH11-B1 TaxID=1768781 RepID=UPI00082E8BDF|nr:hydrolase [Sphingobium sp. CCH11-B1]MEA3388674.1 hydrolase [Pseudomonadota bacterium]
MTGFTPEEQALLDHAAAAPMLAQVQQWSAINSGSRNIPGLDAMAAALADAFSILPGTLELMAGDAVEAVAPDGRTSTVNHGRHLHLSVRPDAPRRILMTGHMDTVFGADHPFQHQRWLEPGRLNGPGVADMKGGIAVMLAALGAFERSSASASIGYDVLVNSDEEVGSPSSATLLRQAAAGKIAAFTYEPALPDGTLAGARAGSGNFSIIVTGRSAHAGRNPDDGRNAVLAAADLALRLKAGSGAGFSCNPAKIDGGGPNNVVPDHAVLRVNFRPRTPQDEIAARALIDRAMADVARDHDVNMHLHGGFGRPPKPMDDKALRLFGLVRRCGTDLGLNVQWRDTGGVCDGNNIAACGVPVVDTMGVRGGAIHSDAEFLLTDSLAERAQLSALALMRIATRQYDNEGMIV